MRHILFVSTFVLFLGLAGAARALTVERQVSPGYVHEHPDEWSVKVERKDDGLVHFTVVRTLAEPRYLVAHLEVVHNGRVIAQSDSPAFGRKQANTFYFSLLPEDVKGSRFDLSESFFNEEDGRATPEPGSIIHQFTPSEFMESAAGSPKQASR